MRFKNIKSIMGGKLGFDAIKMLLMVAKSSRPRFGGLFSVLLSPFVHDGEISVRYTCQQRRYKVWVRTAEESSDALSILELAIRDVYEIDPRFDADLVIDGGGNIGLFTLGAVAAYPRARVVICEPVPSNVAQIEKHLHANNVKAEIRQVCLGGSPRTIAFYCREANQGSFDPTRPYTSCIEIDVLPLKEVVDVQAQRIMIKLDIEGMEMEVLEAYVSGEKRAVCIACELHNHKENKRHIERIFSSQGWDLRFEDETDPGSIFFARSPAAIEFLAKQPGRSSATPGS